MEELRIMYVVLYVVSSVACFLSIFKASKIEDTRIRGSLSILLLLSGIWGVLTITQLVIGDYRAKVIIYTISLVFGLSTVVTWLYFSLEYAGKTIHRNRFLQIVSLLVLVGVFLFKLTNPIHKLYFQAYLAYTPITHLAVQPQGTYVFLSVLAYLFVGVGFYYLYKTFRESQTGTLGLVLLSITTVVPVVLNLASISYEYILQVPYEPIAVSVFGVGTLYLVQESTYNIVPTARRQLALSLPTPSFMVANGKLLGTNEKSRNLFEWATGESKPITELPEEIQRLIDNKPKHGSLFELSVHGEVRYYRPRYQEITLGPRHIGHAYALTDVTKLIQRDQMIEEQRGWFEDIARTISHSINQESEQISLGMSEIGSEDATKIEDANNELAKLSQLISLLGENSPIVTEKQTCDIGELARRARASESSNPDAVSIGDGTAQGERARLLRLFENYYRYVTETEATSVSINVSKQHIELIDNGTNIQTERVKQILEQGEIDTSALHLNVIRTIIAAHLWTVNVQETENGDTLICIDKNPKPEP